MYITLRSNAVQAYLTGRVSNYISSHIGTEVTIGGINIGWFLNIVLEDVRINDKHQQPVIHTNRLVINFGGFSLPRRFLSINRLVLDEAIIKITKYEQENEFNFNFLLDNFRPKDDKGQNEKGNWNLSINSVALKSSVLSLRDYNKPLQPEGFDYNNFVIDNLNLALQDITLQNDTLSTALRYFSGRGSNGFRVEHMEGNLHISPLGGQLTNLVLTTGNSNIAANIMFTYDGFESFSNFAEEVSFKVNLNPSEIDLYETGYFFHGAYGMNNKIRVEGSVAGTLNNLRANDFLFRYGSVTELQGDFYITGLPNLQETYFNLSIERLMTSQSDIESFRLPRTSGIASLVFPDEIARLDSIGFRGNFTGFIYNFVANGQFTSTAGILTTDLAIISNYDFSRFKYRGNLSAQEFNLGKLLNQPDVWGNITFASNLEGSGHSLQTLELQITAMVNSLEYNGYNYQNTSISGNLSNRRFNGSLVMDDPNISLDFAGLVDFSDQVPELNFTARIQNANLSELNITKPDSLYNTYLTTYFTINANGSNINDAEGIFNAYQTVITKKPRETNENLEIHKFIATNISLEKKQLQDKIKQLRFRSDVFDANLQGEFNLENINTSITNFVSVFAPSKFTVDNANNNHFVGQQNLTFDFYVKDSYSLTSLLIPHLRIADNTYLKGYWNTDQNQLNIEGRAEYIALNNLIAQNIKLNVLSGNNQLQINTFSSRINLSDSIWLDNFKVGGSLSQDNMPLTILWDNKMSAKKNNGLIKANARIISPASTELTFEQSNVFVNGIDWIISDNGRLLIDSNLLSFDQIKVFRDNVYLRANGILSHNPDDNLMIEFHRFDVENFNHLLRARRIEFGGIASGNITLSGLTPRTSIISNLFVEKFAFNNDQLGDLELVSYWDNEKKAFRIETNVIYHGNIGFNTPVSAIGYYYPLRSDDNFDIDIVIENFKLSVFGRYLERWASNFRGLASGRLRLEGTPSNPELSGKARVVRTGLKIDFLNTAYTFAHEIEIGKDFIRFDNLVLNDTLGNTGVASGILRHRNFMNFHVDINIMLDRMIVLNTKPYNGTPFYGTGFASGLVRIHGPGSNIVLDISAQANRGTRIFLPLNYQGEVTESNFITFTTPETPLAGTPTRRSLIRTLTLNFDLNLTPESEIQIIFDSRIGDIIRSRGSGNLRFELTPQGAFYIYGDYIIDDGEYLFTLQNLLNKRFSIEQGGVIRWNGNPNDSEIDIRAIYRTRTTLADLTMPLTQTEASNTLQRRVPVETILHLTNSLLRPTINFDIQLPGGDEATRELMQRLISTEQEMNRQVFSLLILNRFTPNATMYNTTLGYSVGSTSFDLLSNQLSNWLSQISSDLDIGINYRPGDEITSQEVEVALSTQLFNNRLSIDGNVGVAGNHPAQTQRTSNIIGDVIIEYRITPEGRFRIKAFNRSNTIDILNTQALYTQGIGLFYRKEFDNLTDLFRRNRRATLDEVPEPDEIESSLPDSHSEVNLVPNN